MKTMKTTAHQPRKVLTFGSIKVLALDRFQRVRWLNHNAIRIVNQVFRK